MDSARHVMGCHSTQETRVQIAFDDVTSTIHQSLTGGHLAVLKWARDHDCPWNAGTCTAAARFGHLDMLKWAREHHCPWNAETCASAAQHGNMEVLQWARAHHCPWDAWTCAHAARRGDLDMLQWARERGCPWDAHTCALAARGGHTAVLQWAREHDCPWQGGNGEQSLERRCVPPPPPPRVNIGHAPISVECWFSMTLLSKGGDSYLRTSTRPTLSRRT